MKNAKIFAGALTTNEKKSTNTDKKRNF